MICHIYILCIVLIYITGNIRTSSVSGNILGVSIVVLSIALTVLFFYNIHKNRQLGKFLIVQKVYCYYYGMQYDCRYTAKLLKITVYSLYSIGNNN